MGISSSGGGVQQSAGSSRSHGSIPVWVQALLSMPEDHPISLSMFIFARPSCFTRFIGSTNTGGSLSRVHLMVVLSGHCSSSEPLKEFLTATNRRTLLLTMDSSLIAQHRCFSTSFDWNVISPLSHCTILPVV